ncbi:MAG: hypothetical protein ACKVVP_15015 [Chloroflexota bacterium]
MTADASLRASNRIRLQAIASFERFRDVVCLAMLAMLVGFALFEPLTSGRLVIGHDMDEHFNREAFNRQAFALGRLPLWNPYVFSGFPAQADIQTGVFYPPHWLLRLLPLELGAFFMWSLALHIWLLGAGTYALCRQVGISRLAGLTAGIGLMLGGVAMPRIFAGHLLIIYGFCWMPLAVALAIRSMHSGKLLPHPGLVLTLMVQFLAGASQPSAYTLALVALTAILQVLWPISIAQRRLARLVPLGQLTVLAGLFVGLSAFQALPMLRFMLETARGGGISYEQATKGSIIPVQLWTVVFPNALTNYQAQFQDGLSGGLWEKSPYVGFLLAAAAPLALTSTLRRLGVFFGLVALGALAFAFGEHLPAYQLHYLLLPGFRIPSRLLSVFALAVAVLGAMGLDTLVRGSARGRLSRVATGIYVSAVALGTLTLVVLQPSVQAAENLAVRPLLNGLDLRWLAVQGAALLAILAIARLTQRTTPALLLAGLLVTVDVMTFAGQFLTINGPGIDQEAKQAFTPLHAGRVLSICQSSISANSMIGLQVPGVDGHNSAFLRAYADYTTLVRGEEPGNRHPSFPKVGTEGIPKNLALLNAINVTHIHSCAELDEQFPRVETTPTWQIYENPSALPRAFLVCQVERVSSETRAARTMRDDKFNPARQAIVIAGDPGVAQLPNLSRPCTEHAEVQVVSRDTPGGDLVVDVHAPSSGLLVIAETYYPEREAWIDGQRVPLVRVNYALSGLALTPGLHRLELHYVPSSFYLGSAISGLTALFWIGIIGLTQPRAHTSGSNPVLTTPGRDPTNPLGTRDA